MDRCATTTMQQTYILQGYGAIQPDWVQRCLQLFKSREVNLRKVVLLKNGDPHCFSMLEIHFGLPLAIPNPTSDETALHSTTGTVAAPHPFLAQLEGTLAQQDWHQQKLSPSPR